MQEDKDRASVSVYHEEKSKKPLVLVAVGLLGVLLAGSLAYSGYAYNKVQQLNKETKQLSDKVSTAEASNKKLTEENKKLKATDNSDGDGQTAGNDSTEATDNIDGNFVALAPNSGYMASNNETTFEFTPHKKATKYVVELKFLGQQNYPTTQPADQTVTFKDTASQPARIKVTKTIPDGDYQWRVTAISVVNGKETVLQSTDSWNYQIR